MNDRDQSPNESESERERELRRTVEQDRFMHRADIAAAKARTAGEWYDLFLAIGLRMARQVFEAKGPEAMKAYEREISEREPFQKKNSLRHGKRPFKRGRERCSSRMGCPLPKNSSMRGHSFRMTCWA